MPLATKVLQYSRTLQLALEDFERTVQPITLSDLDFHHNCHSPFYWLTAIAPAGDELFGTKRFVPTVLPRKQVRPARRRV
ncbi:MAG TPA: hypothetical protein VIP79_01255, partial [Gemmatimonadaceae bacterium]